MDTRLLARLQGKTSYGDTSSVSARFDYSYLYELPLPLKHMASSKYDTSNLLYANIDKPTWFYESFTYGSDAKGPYSSDVWLDFRRLSLAGLCSDVDVESTSFDDAGASKRLTEKATCRPPLRTTLLKDYSRLWRRPWSGWI